MTRYHDMLMAESWEFMGISKHNTLSSLVEATKNMELELETQQRKRRQD